MVATMTVFENISINTTMYGLILEHLREESEGVWHRGNILLAANFTLFAGIGSFYFLDQQEIIGQKLYIVSLLVSIFGFFLTFLSWEATANLWWWADHWKNELMKIEKVFAENGIPTPVTTGERLRRDWHFDDNRIPFRSTNLWSIRWKVVKNQPYHLGLGIAWIFGVIEFLSKLNVLKF